MAGGGVAVEFGADGVEIHEPALEQRPRHRLQRRVHPPVQLDLVVQRLPKRCDSITAFLGRPRKGKLANLFQIQRRLNRRVAPNVHEVLERATEQTLLNEVGLG